MLNQSVRPRRDAQVMEARRLAAVLRLEQGESLSAIARRLGVSRQAVHQWAQRLRRRGLAGLRRRPRPGRPPKLARRQLAQLPRLLARGAEAYGFSSPVWTTQRVADLVWQRFRVRYHRDHVCCLLRRFGWSWQKPTGRARERDEAAIRHWVDHTWPRLKKRANTERHTGLCGREWLFAAAHRVQDLGAARADADFASLLQLAETVGHLGGLAQPARQPASGAGDDHQH